MRRAAVIAVAVAVTACGGGGGRADPSDAARSTSAATQPRPAPAQAQAPAPRLTGSHPCPGAKGFTCSSLAVALDHSGRTPGELRLSVAAAGNADAPKGVLVDLIGGPG